MHHSTSGCEGRGDCQNVDACLTHELWSELSQRLYQFLDGITLSQFVDRPGIPELSMQRDKMNGRFILARRQAEAINQGII